MKLLLLQSISTLFLAPWAVYVAAASSSSASALLTNNVENLRANATSIRQAGLVDVIQAPSEDGSGKSKEYGICNVATMYGFTKGKLLPIVQVGIVGRIAIEHLNNGDGSIIPEIEGLNERCNIRFTNEMVDTMLKADIAIDKFVGMNERESKRPCAIVTAPDASVPLAVLSGVFDVPQLSGIAVDQSLNNKDTYPTFARTIPDDVDRAQVVIKYLCDEIGTRHMAVLHGDDQKSISLLSAAVSSAVTACPEMKILPFSVPAIAFTEIRDGNVDKVKQALVALKASGYRHISFLGAGNVASLVLEVASDVGVIGPEYFWVTTSFKIGDVEKGSKLHKVVPGVASITFEAGVPGGSERHDALVAEFQSLANPQDLKYIDEMMGYPSVKDDGKPVLPPPSFNQIFTDFPFFVYDAIIALGLAACNSTKDDGTYFDGTALYETYLETTFEGTTGNIRLNKETGTRDPETVYFSVANFRDEPSDVEGMVKFVAKQTHLFRNNVWETVDEFIYSSGMLEAPPDSPVPIVNYNYIGTGLRAAGLSLCAMILALSIVCAAWTKYHEKKTVVRASQPIFLLIICAGTFLMGTAIIPLSIDDELVSPAGCDIACMSIPYLICIGFTLVFAALFSKMWRVNKIFNNPALRRIKVTALDVSKPLFVLLATNIIILIVWTSISPLVWVREAVSEDIYGNPTESMGLCKSDKALPFAITLLILDLGAMSFALHQAYLARNIAVEFAESSYIMVAIGCIVLVCFMGIPIIIISQENSKARFFVLTCIIFVMTMSLLICIFGPKEKFRRNKGAIKDSIKRSSQIPAGMTSSVGGYREGTPSTFSNISGDGEGLRILNDPQTVATLEDKIANLTRANSRLTEMNEKLKSPAITANDDNQGPARAHNSLVTSTDECNQFLGFLAENEEAAPESEIKELP